MMSGTNGSRTRPAAFQGLFRANLLAPGMGIGLDPLEVGFGTDPLPFLFVTNPGWVGRRRPSLCNQRPLMCGQGARSQLLEWPGLGTQRPHARPLRMGETLAPQRGECCRKYVEVVVATVRLEEFEALNTSEGAPMPTDPATDPTSEAFEELVAAALKVDPSGISGKHRYKPSEPTEPDSDDVNTISNQD